MAAMEFQAQYLDPNKIAPRDGLEFNLNHFPNRLGNKLPKMSLVIPINLPTGINHQMNWETLTQGESARIGLPPVKK
jgi:hypothetical protein